MRQRREVKPKQNSVQALNFAEAKLSSAGFRITKPRQAVLKVLIESGVPLTVAEIFSRVSKRAAIDRVSTYRVVEVLQEQELIHPVGDARFIFCSHLQSAVDHHLYLICRICAAITEIDLPESLEQAMAQQIRKQAQFKSHGQIQVYGQCALCPVS